MKIKRRAGFTMVEMVVVFMVMSVFIGVSVPPIQAYYENTSYKDVQNRAETVFYAAQQTLTSMSLSSQIEPFFQRVHEDAVNVDNVLFEYLELTDDSAQDNRYYAVRYKKSDLNNPNASEGKLVLDLLQNLITEKDIFNASITIELDSHTYTIQTVFYMLEDVTFTYKSGSGVSGSVISLVDIDRTDETLKQLKLGMAEANVSYKALSEDFEVQQKPFVVSDIELKNPDSGVVGGGEGSDDGGGNGNGGEDDERWEDDPTEEDDPPGDGGDPGVIMDQSNPFSVYLNWEDSVKVRSVKIHWWSPDEGSPTVYKYKLYYLKKKDNWQTISSGPVFSNNGSSITLDEINPPKTTGLKIDIISNSDSQKRYGFYEITVYAQENNGSYKWDIVPIVVTFANRN